MEENKNIEKSTRVIDFEEISKILWAKRKLFFIVLPIVFALSCLWILPQPRYYTSTITLAPEMDNISSGGSLSSLASSFGIELGGGSSMDAIYPTLYPELLKSSNFVVKLFDLPVQSVDGSIKTNYYNYLDKHQKYCFWDIPKRWFQSFVSSLTPDTPAAKGASSSEIDPFRLTKRQNSIVNKVNKYVSCDIDKKTDMIILTVQDQDPLICATMADSIRMRLQTYIIDYRTKKARHDVEYYTKLVKNAKADYDKALATYSSYTDGHLLAATQGSKSQMEKLAKAAELKFQTYSTLNVQLQSSLAKVQERTPAFTVIQEASVPIKPAGPKRILFIFGMTFLAFLGVSLYSLRKMIFV